MKTRIKLIIAALLAAFLAGALIGCGTDASQPTPAPVATEHVAVCKQPVRLLLLADLTASGARYGVALPDRSDLDKLAQIVEVCTGEVGFGTVESTPSNPLSRLRIEASKHNLTEPKRGDFEDPFAYNNALAQYRHQAEEAAAEEAQRKERIASDKRDFLDRAELVLLNGATHRSTDLNGAIRRMNVFHQESTALKVNETKYAILVTDGQHNRSGSHFEKTNPDVTTLVVYGSSDMGVLSTLDPPALRFESVKAAIQYVKNKEVGR